METRKGILVLLAIFGLAPWALLFFQSTQMHQIRSELLDPSSDTVEASTLRDERDAAEAKARRLETEITELRTTHQAQREELGDLRENMEKLQEEHRTQLQELAATAEATAERASAIEADYREALRLITRLRTEQPVEEEPQSTRRSIFGGRSPEREQTREIIPGPPAGEVSEEDLSFESPPGTRRQAAPQERAPEVTDEEGEPIRSSRGGWRVIDVN